MSDKEREGSVQSSHGGSHDDLLESFGYKQELDRGMGTFSAFAASFSGVSISAAIFLLLAFMFTQAGSAGLWTWVGSTIGAFLMALVFGDLVGRLPIAGYAYQWSSRLTTPRLGWFVAVCGLIGFAVGAAGTIYGVTPYFLSEFGLSTGRNANIIGAIVLTVIVATLNIAGVRIVARINNVAVVTEILGGVGIAIAILLYTIIKDPRPASVLFQQQPGAHGSYFGSFILAFLVGAFSYAAWELPADMAEETKDAPNVAAKTMRWSIMAVGICGLTLLVGYTYAAPNLTSIASSSTPVLDIIRYRWGNGVARGLDVIFLISFIAVCLLIMAGAGRLWFSLARDNMTPFSSLFAKVSQRYKTPHTALICVSLFAIGMFTIPALISATALSYVVGTASVGYNLVYAIIAAIFVVMSRRGTLPKQHGRYGLGRWAVPVASIAFLWQLFLVGTMTVPKVNQAVGWTTGAMILVGAVWYVVAVHGRIGRGAAGPATPRPAAPEEPAQATTASS